MLWVSRRSYLAYVYGMMKGRFRKGGQPKEGLVAAFDGDESVGFKSMGYGSILFYDRKLGEEEARRYKLDFIHEVPLEPRL